MIDDSIPFSKSAPEDFRTLVREGVKDAADQVRASAKNDAPVMSDVLARLVRQAPFAALAIAFLAGAVIARRR